MEARDEPAQWRADPRIAVLWARAVLVLEVAFEASDAPVPSVPRVRQVGVGERDRGLAAIRVGPREGSERARDGVEADGREVGEQRRCATLTRFGQLQPLDDDSLADGNRCVRLVDADGPFTCVAERRGVGQGQQPEASRQLGPAAERLNKRPRQPIAGPCPAPWATLLDEWGEHKPIGLVTGDGDDQAVLPLAVCAGQLAGVEEPEAIEGDKRVARAGAGGRVGRLGRRPLTPQLVEEQRAHVSPRPPRRVGCVSTPAVAALAEPSRPPPPRT